MHPEWPEAASPCRKHGWVPPSTIGVRVMLLVNVMLWAAVHVAFTCVFGGVSALVLFVAMFTHEALPALVALLAGVGWLGGILQQQLADDALAVRLPSWGRIGLVSGIMLGCTVAAMPHTPASNTTLVTTLAIYTIIVVTLLQMWALERTVARAWLWALPAPLAAWALVSFVSDNFSWAATMGALAGYHLAGGLVLALLAHQSAWRGWC